MKIKEILLLPLLSFMLFFLTSPVFGQVMIVANSTATVTVKPSDCIENLDGFRYKFYLDSDYNLTTPVCAALYREATFNFEDAIYDGDFRDYHSDGTLVATGTYKDGYLNGEIAAYYLNGNLWQEGVFLQGGMVGTWNYYYPDGEPMYTLEFIGDDVKLLNVWDINGNQVLRNGSGEIIIPHFKSSSVTKVPKSFWRGTVRTGSLEGKWQEYKEEDLTGVEELYRAGKFIKGYDNKRFYNIMSFFSAEQDLPFLKAENFSLIVCNEDKNKIVSIPYYPRGSKKLNVDVKNKIGEYSPIKDKDVVVTVSFMVNEDGTLSDFQRETNYGKERSLVRALEKLGPWEPAIFNNKAIVERVTFSIKLVAKAQDYLQDRSTRKSNQSHQDLKDQQKTFNPPSIYQKD